MRTSISSGSNEYAETSFGRVQAAGNEMSWPDANRGAHADHGLPVKQPTDQKVLYCSQ